MENSVCLAPLDAEVIHVASPERSLNWRYFEDVDPNKLRKGGFQVIAVDRIPDYLQEGYVLPRYLEEGALLFRNPFERNTYVRVEQASLEFRRTNFLYVSRILQLLGASGYKVHIESDEIAERRWDANVPGSWSIIPVQVSVDYDSKVKMGKTLGFELNDSWGGFKYVTEKEWLEAKRVASESDLMKDSFIKSIIEQRNPEIRNAIKSRTYTLDVSGEENHDFDLAFCLSALSAFNLNASVKKAVSQQRRMRIKIEFFFPDK